MGLKAELVRYSKLCYTNRLVAATDGNLSVRTKKNFVISTCANVNKGKIKLNDLIKTDLKGKKKQGRKNVSSEIKLHLYIYSKRKDINAVVHTHPRFATAFAAAGIALDKAVLPEVYLKLKKIPLAKYATPSTEEVCESIEQYIINHNAILLGNHGLVTFGKTIDEAYYLTEKAEQFAEISFYARLLGGEKQLTKLNLKKLDELKTGKSK
jgi:L-fuculose-phosphate aldolase